MTIRGGIDLGGTKIQAVVVGDGADVLGSSRMPTPTSGGPPDVAATMAAAIRDAAEQAGAGTGDLEGVGVGSPGAVADDEGTVAKARNLPDWEAAYPLRDDLASQLDTKVRLGNDVQVATDAEFELGAGRQYNSILGVFWGTGVGGGIVLDGKPWLGRSAAGEIGHVVIEMGGRRCPCGRRGCMEAYAGRLALENRARELEEKGQETKLFEIMEERGRDRLTSGVWSRALKAEDAVAQKLHRPGREGARRGNRVVAEPARRGGRGDRRRNGPAARGAVRAQDPRRDDAPPVRGHASAGRAGATLGDLGGAIGASLLVKQGRSG